MSSAAATAAVERMPWLPLATMASALYCMAAGFSFVFAVLPPVGRQLGLSELQVALVISPAALVFVVCNGLWGRLVDRLGRKQVILTAIVATVASSAVMGLVVKAGLGGLVTGAWLVLAMSASRIIQAGFGAGFFPASQALVADITETEQRVRGFAVIGTGFALGMVTGPALASIFSGFGIVAPFFAVSGLAVVVLGLALFTLPKTAARPLPAGSVRAKTGFGDLWPFLTVLMLVFSTYGILLQVTGFRLQDDFGMDPPLAAQNSGWVLMATAGGLVGTQILVARLRMSARQSALAMGVGALLALAAVLLLLSGGTYVAVLLTMALFGVGLGTAMPSAQGLLTVVAERAGDQGRVAGMAGAAQGLAMVIGPLVGALAYQSDHGLPYVAGAVMLIAAAAVACLAAPGRLRR